MWNRDSAVKSDATKESPGRRAPGLPAEERRVIAWVGQSVIFTGTLVSSEDMTIDGHVEGTIEVREHGLTIGPHADIRADMMAKVVTIHGAVIGNVTASFKIDIRETGRVEGDIIAPRIVVAEGGVLHGRIITTREADEAPPPRASLAVTRSSVDG
jgi:cytoskeletal protein CcmA (bactofilin family)